MIILEVAARLAGEVIDFLGEEMAARLWVEVELNEGHWVLREALTHETREKLGAP